MLLASMHDGHTEVEDLTPDESSLVERLRNNDSFAWDELLKTESQFLQNYLQQEFPNLHYMHEDIIAIVWRKAFEKISIFRGNAAIRTWLASILRHTAISYWRSVAHRKSNHFSLDTHALSPDEHECLHEPSMYNPVRQVLLNELSQEVRAAIDSLKPKFRDIVLLSMEGCEYADIASRLGIKVGTVRSRLSRGREKLNEILSGKDLINA